MLRLRGRPDLRRRLSLTRTHATTKRLHATNLLLSSIGSLLLIACSTSDPAPSGAPLPVIAQYSEASEAFPAAGIRGTVVEQDGCIRVRTDDDPRGRLLVWQPDYQIQRNGERIEIVDGSGKVVARVGESIDIGGGEVPAFEDRLKAPLPPACTGPYWMVAPP
jgi:hypothetical protein